MGNKYLGEKVKSRRLELNMSQEELAKKSGYKSKSTINKIEQGINDISMPKLDEIADALECSPLYLLGWTDTNAEKATFKIERVKEDDNYYIEEDTREMANFLATNPEYKVLFDASRKVKKEDIEKAMMALNIFKEDE